MICLFCDVDIFYLSAAYPEDGVDPVQCAAAIEDDILYECYGMMESSKNTFIHGVNFLYFVVYFLVHCFFISNVIKCPHFWIWNSLNHSDEVLFVFVNLSVVS